MSSFTVDEKLAFLKKAFGSVQNSRDGANVGVPCPKCKEKGKKKLAIRLDNDLCHCWVCSLSGKLVSVLRQHRPSHVKEYVTRFGASDVRFLVDAPAEVTLEVPVGFKLLAQHTTSGDYFIKGAINYIKGRGLTERDLWYFRFGLSTDPLLRGRVIMPSFDAKGELNFFTGRATNPSTFRKYMNCDAEKKSMVFNELNLDWSKELTLVEGPFDLTKCDENATCLLGNSLSEDSLLFYRIYQNKTPIIIALDDDMQARAWQRIARMLSSYDIPVRVLPLGQRHDVGEMTRDEFLRAKERAVVWDRDGALQRKISSLRL